MGNRGLFDAFSTRRLARFFDRLSFVDILIIWLSIISIFGLLYYFLSGGASYLFSTQEAQAVTDVYDSIYFSFITATSTGLGDIHPLGAFKLITIIEVILGLLLLAVVTSKLVSLKQNAILVEIYEISFKERVNRLRSALLLFRQNIGRMINMIELETIHKREIKDTYIYLSAFEDCLRQIITLMTRPTNSHFRKVLDQLSTEILLNSTISSFRKIKELVAALNERGHEWKRDTTENLINSCIGLNEHIFVRLSYSKNISKKSIEGLVSEKEEMITELKKELKKDPRKRAVKKTKTTSRVEEG